MDVGGDLLESYWPDNEECFCLSITVSIGIKGEDGAVNYNLMVCTPDWLKNKIKASSVEWGRHKLIINKFDPGLIKGAVEEKLYFLLEKFPNDDGMAFSEKLGRYAHWEFEDYIPHK